MNYITSTIQPYILYLPYFMLAFFASFLLTPVVGFIARKFGIVDLPAKMRKPSDSSKKTRIAKRILPRAGGLAVIIPFLIILLSTAEIDRQVIALCIGVVILAIVGVLDDKFELGSRYQITAQIIAAILIVAVGISIDSVQSPFDTSFSLRMLVFPFSIGAGQYSIALPADLITIAWIVMMTNAINWVFGADSLGEGISTIAFITILFIGVKYNTPLSAFIATIAAGGILGFLPFNIHPSKILSGTAGTTVYGFLIAVLSILGGVKVSASVIVLLIPLIDMIWVMVGRINRNGVKNISDVFRVTTTGDDTHLHHRLLKLGFSQTSVALIEWLAVAICAIIAFATADLPKVTIIAIIGGVILILFIVITSLISRGKKINGNGGPEGPVPPTEGGKVEPEQKPEEKYAY